MAHTLPSRKHLNTRNLPLQSADNAKYARLSKLAGLPEIGHYVTTVCRDYQTRQIGTCPSFLVFDLKPVQRPPSITPAINIPALVCVFSMPGSPATQTHFALLHGQ